MKSLKTKILLLIVIPFLGCNSSNIEWTPELISTWNKTTINHVKKCVDHDFKVSVDGVDLSGIEELMNYKIGNRDLLSGVHEKYNFHDSDTIFIWENFSSKYRCQMAGNKGGAYGIREEFKEFRPSESWGKEQLFEVLTLENNQDSCYSQFLVYPQTIYLSSIYLPKESKFSIVQSAFSD